jgi:hypothetical protein
MTEKGWQLERKTKRRCYWRLQVDVDSLFQKTLIITPKKKQAVQP